MNIESLYPAVDLVRSRGYHYDASEATELRTYPMLLAAARLPARDPLDAFLRAAALAYSRLPQRLCVDPDRLSEAAAAFAAVLGGASSSSDQIDPIAACLSSLVGASRVLHLGNPAAYPIWDQRVERFRLNHEPSIYHMGQTNSYLSYLEDIREITAHPLFLTFHHEYCTAYQGRLQRLQIPPYPLTEPRVVESAASELAAEA